MDAYTGEGYRFGRFTLNLDRAALQADGADLDLRPKSFDVLRYLVERAGRIASKDEIVAAVWPNVVVSDDSLAQCIRDIRKALGDDSEQFIKTVPRRGYMFVAEVAPLGDFPAPSQSDTAVSAPLRRWPAAILTGVSFAVVLAALAAWSGGWFAPKPPAREARLTIAVLPFANLGDRPGEDWLADGIAEDIMTAVSRFRDLTVIARNSSFRFRGDVDVREVGKQLNADYVLQGSVRRSGDNLRITAQLVDAHTGATRWSERYDRPYADVFAIQDQVASSVSALLVSHVREAAVLRISARPPERLEVYELALRGRRAYRTFTREGAVEAQALAERAIAIDPEYASSWEVLASALMQFYIQPYGEHQGSQAMLARARAAGERAVALDGNFALGWATLAFALVWSHEHDASLAAARKSIELNPNDATTYAIYGNILSFSGLMEESIEAWEQAFRLDPFQPPIWLALSSIPRVLIGRFEEVLPRSRSCARRAPKLFPCFIYLAIAAHEAGLEEESREAGSRLLQAFPNFTIGRWLRLAPYRNESDANRFIELMRRAGLPE